MNHAVEVGTEVIKLRLFRGDEVVRSFKVHSGTLTIGTAKECTIRAAGDPSLSPKHVTIYLDEGALMVVPEPGASVLLNGELVDFAVPGPDDLVKVGRLTFKMELAESLESIAPPADRTRAPAPAPSRVSLPAPVPASARVSIPVPVPAPSRVPVPVPIPVSVSVPAPSRVPEQAPKPDTPPKVKAHAAAVPPLAEEPDPPVLDEVSETITDQSVLAALDEVSETITDQSVLAALDDAPEALAEETEYETTDDTQVVPSPEFIEFPRRLPTIPEVCIDPKELEDESRYTTQVITVWLDTVVQFTIAKAGSRRSGRFNVGEASGCDFPIQSHLLNGHTKLPLIFSNRRGSWITIPPEPRGNVTFEDGSCVALADLVSAGHAEPSTKVRGCHRFLLPPKASAEVDIGEFGFFINSVARPRKLVGAGQRSRGNIPFLFVSVLAHCLVLFLSFFDVSGSPGIDIDPEATQRAVHYNLSPVELERIEKKLEEDKEAAKDKERKEKQNEVSKLDSDQPTRSSSGRSTPTASTSVRNVLSILNRNREKEIDLPVGPLIPGKTGFSIAGAIASLPTQEVSISSGGGSGLIATLSGEQVAGKGTGVAKLVKSERRGSVRGKVTKMSSELKVQGSLSREEVSRVVNAHINQIQACYERALLGNPTLSGRIVFDWTVTKTGRVTGVRVRSSTLSSPNAASCISSLIRGWKFPIPKGGEVVITYPFLFRSMSS